MVKKCVLDTLFIEESIKGVSFMLSIKNNYFDACRICGSDLHPLSYKMQLAELYIEQGKFRKGKNLKVCSKDRMTFFIAMTNALERLMHRIAWVPSE